MAEKITVNFKELPLEPLEPDKLRELLALTYDVGAMPVFVHDQLTVEVTGPGFVIVAAGKAQEEEMPGPGPVNLRRTVEIIVKATCVCSDWDVGMKQISAQQAFSSFQSAGPEYDGSMFRYCPWCGIKLLECEKLEEVAVGCQ